MLKPSRIQPGDTIGIISPSWGGAGMFPHRIELATQYVQLLGYKVKIAPHAMNQNGFVSDTPEHRAEDIHTLFRDPEVKAIVASIGGDHSCHLLSLLDFDLIRSNPKIFMGYSDITVLNIAIYSQTGLVTFNGPAFMTDFAEQPRMYDYTERYLWKTITQAEPVGQIEPSSYWTEEFLDWEQKAELERPRSTNPSGGWTWLKAGTVEGTLMGGCLESLQHLRGTRYWHDWQDAIFFFETSEEKPSPETVDGILMDYENMGVLDKLKGLLVGRPMFYNDEEKAQLREVILERTHKYSFPVITDMDFGHTAPQMTLPIGCRARINSANQQFEIIEAAVV